MGTELLRRRCELPLEISNLTTPHLVSQIHAAYRSAGAQILTTNTFGANRFRLPHHDIRPVCLEGARLAQEVAQGALVAGSVGPTGRQNDLPKPGALRDAFREQAAALEAGGVNLYICETFGDIEELCAAIAGIREASESPIIASMTYLADGSTPLGLTPSDVVQALADLPLAAIGVNCAVGLETVERIVRELHAATDLPIMAQPNAGQPKLVDGELKYPVAPDAFAHLAERLARWVTVLGGCCGTTPEHIAAVHNRLGRPSA